ncbi:uncharacterized protein LOC111047334 isoform X2 [Nilaparvata lugens]|uniref:uncharacterized protein LOC111047334 isoform X2 n=1 Tax=Nilaparvata lugens TaxID=108931 RepID=UPI00193D2276|nr:uncharacterized protein LOC111047334 isoform X2 [Nilaparvata lugens]
MHRVGNQFNQFNQFDTIVVNYVVSCYLLVVVVALCVPLSFVCVHSFCMKMNDELLIECVRKYEFLYNLQHPKYMDVTKKDVAWKDIEDQMKQPGPACKQRWQNLRDSYRRALNKRKVKTGQAATKIKKWKYEDEMSFVAPFFAEKKTLDSVDITSDEDNGDHDDHTVVDHTSETETNAIIETASDDVATDAQTVESSVQNSKPVKRRFKNRTPQSASAVLMAKLLDSQNSLVPQKEPDELDRFFLNISEPEDDNCRNR